MACNAEDRLAEAKARTGLGEVAALEESLRRLRQRRVEAEHANPQFVDGDGGSSSVSR